MYLEDQAEVLNVNINSRFNRPKVTILNAGSHDYNNDGHYYTQLLDIFNEIDAMDLEDYILSVPQL